MKLKVAMAMMADRDNAARDVAAELGVSLSTLYAYVDANGKPRERANELLAQGKTLQILTVGKKGREQGRPSETASRLDQVFFPGRQQRLRQFAQRPVPGTAAGDRVCREYQMECFSLETSRRNRLICKIT